MARLYLPVPLSRGIDRWTQACWYPGLGHSSSVECHFVCFVHYTVAVVEKHVFKNRLRLLMPCVLCRAVQLRSAAVLV